MKDLKSINIIYSFYQYDYNSLLCGEREGQLQVVFPNNLGRKELSFNLGSCGHIIQISKTHKPGEILMACSRGLFFADVHDIGEMKVVLN